MKMTILFACISVATLFTKLASADDTTETRLLEFEYWSPSHQLSQCEGDCDSDADCKSYLVCWHNDAYDVPPGCHGEVVAAADYCVLEANIPDPTPEPTPEPTRDLDLESEVAMQCQSNYNLGTFANAVLCAAEALETSECDTSDGVSIMWDDAYSVNEPSWGCRCCRRDAVLSDHTIWSLMTYALPEDHDPTPEPTEQPTFALVLESEAAEQCQSNYNLGTFSNSKGCASAAVTTDECDTSDGINIMWHDGYSVLNSAWGCRCCRADAVYSDHDIWTLMTYEMIPIAINDAQPMAFGEWLANGVQFLKIPDRVPTLFVLAVAISVLAAVAVVRCCRWKMAQKPYKTEGTELFGDVIASDVDTEVDQPNGA